MRTLIPDPCWIWLEWTYINFYCYIPFKVMTVFHRWFWIKWLFNKLWATQLLKEQTIWRKRSHSHRWFRSNWHFHRILNSRTPLLPYSSSTDKFFFSFSFSLFPFPKFQNLSHHSHEQQIFAFGSLKYHAYCWLDCS